MSFRVLHVDDDPLMREVVELSLGLDPAFTVASCAGGDEALAVVAEWKPDLILCDAMMPGMDGPALLARLRENKDTAEIPVIFMTTRPHASKVERLAPLGAVAMIEKPFEPQTLAATLRRHIQTIKFASGSNELPKRLAAEPVPVAAPSTKLVVPEYDFGDRLRADAAALANFRTQLIDGPEAPLVPDGMLSCVHKLAGAAGVFNFQAVSADAAALEDAIIERCAGRGTARIVETKLVALLECIARE